MTKSAKTVEPQSDTEGTEEIWALRLYIAGQTPKSIAAFANLKKICEAHLPGRYKIEVVDLLKQPQLAAGDRLQLKFNGRSVEGRPLANGELVTVRAEESSATVWSAPFTKLGASLTPVTVMVKARWGLPHLISVIVPSTRMKSESKAPYSAWVL